MAEVVPASCGPAMTEENPPVDVMTNSDLFAFMLKLNTNSLERNSQNVERLRKLKQSDSPTPNSQSMEKIEPQNVKGFRDLLPRNAYRKNKIISIIRKVYESYGFLPVETPGLEYLEILLGEYGEENTKQIFRFKSPEEQDVAQRFDLTVPLARIVAQYNDLPKPFKRYQVGSVWRADKPDPGRFREFTQFDVDVVGTSSQLAEA